MEPLLSESYSGVEVPLRQIIREAADWAEFWSRVYANRSPKPRPPAIDFKREMVIVAAMGQRGTGGYTIAIQRIYRVEKGLLVVVKETSPAAGCMLTHAFTAPVTAVRLPRLDVPMTYIETKETENCG